MKHVTGLAHVALYTKDMDASVKFYEMLGGVVSDQAEVKKPNGTNDIKILHMPGFFLEIIKPYDESLLTAKGGLFPHIALEVDDVDAVVAELKAAGVNTFCAPEPISMPILGGIRNIFFYGPDGEYLELLQHL